MRDGWAQLPSSGSCSGPDEAFRSSLRSRAGRLGPRRVPLPALRQVAARDAGRLVMAAAVVAAAGIVRPDRCAHDGLERTPGTGGQATRRHDGTGRGRHVGGDRDGRAATPVPLPTYDFMLGANAETGVVTGFNGCGGVAGTWGLDDGQLHVSIDTGGGGQPCAYHGATTPLALPDDGASMASLDGELVMRLGDDGDTIAHRVDGLSPPSSLASSSWLFPVDGPDLTVAFEAGAALLVSVDTTTCTTGAYRFDGTTLQVSSPMAGTTSGRCQGAVPTPLRWHTDHGCPVHRQDQPIAAVDHAERRNLACVPGCIRGHNGARPRRPRQIRHRRQRHLRRR